MKRNGFTLIELMVTMAVLAILISVGLPAFEETIKDNRILAEQRQLLAAINLARSEASHRNQIVTISSKGGASWEQGLRIYTDAEAAGNTAYAAGVDTLLKDISASEANDLDIRSSGNQYISFRSNGMLNEGGDGVILAICDDRGASEGRTITINLVGRASVSAPSANCTP